MSRTDILSRHIPAVPEQVYAALVDPEALCSWLPPKGWSCRFERFPRNGEGSFRIIYNDEKDQNSEVLEARLLENIPRERLVLEAEFQSEDPDLADTLQLIWEIAPLAGGSIITLSARNVPIGITAEGQREGMTTALANLADHLARQVEK